jgi:hypothetical protein
MARELEIKVTVESTQAEASLGKLEDALKDVGTAAQKTADATKVYESAAGTAGRSATGLTDANAALTNQIMKYVSYAAIGAAIDRSIEFGSAVNDLSIRTGVGTDALQSLGFVASQTGSSMETMARAVTFLDKTLESGGRKAVMAVDALGLSTSNLLQLSPEDRFRAVASAIGQMGNDAEQAQAATALFGRAGAELIPMFEELARGAEDTSLVMSQEVIGSLDEAGDAMNYATAAGRSFLGVVVAVGVETVKMLVEPFTLARQVTQGLGDDLAELAQELPKVADITSSLMPATLPDLTVDNFAKVSAALDKQRQESDKAAKAAERLAEAQRKAYESSLVWGDGIDAAINYVARLTSEIDALHTRSGRKLSDILDFEALPYDKAVEDLTRFQGSIKSFSAESSKLWVPFVASATKAVSDVASSFGNLRGAFSNLGQTIVGAIQGGGNVVGSIGASLLGGLGKDLGQKLGNAIGGTLGSTLGSFGGPLGSIAGSLAGTLVGKLFGPSQQSQVTQMRNKFLDASGGLDTLRQRADAAGVSMAGLLNARSARQFESEVERLNAALKESEQRTQDTYAAMERWGLSITDLGPKFAQQDINKRLLSIMKDMELLTSAGAEFNTVAAKMGPEIGKLVQEAIEAGGTVPMELQPIIKKMIELGLLTDKNGDKFTELSQVPFAQNMNEQFGKLINKMDELISKFAAMTDGIDRSQRSAEHLSDTITGITPPTWLDQSPTFVGFDRGGVVGRTFARPSVRDTIPALLRPGEVVLTPEQVSGGLGRSTTAVAVTINVAGYLDSSTARASLADVVKTELSKQLRREGRAA